MSKVILEFDSTEEYEAKRAMGAADSLCAMWDLDQEFRKVIKYDDHSELVNKVIKDIEESNRFRSSYTSSDPKDTPDTRTMLVAPDADTLHSIIDTVTQHWRTRLWELRSEHNVVEDR